MAITRGNWDLHQSGSKDAARHREKLKDAFKKKLHDIISEESIITPGENGKKVKVPIKALDNYRFVFDPKKQKNVGQGDGETEVGDVLEKEQQKGQKPGDKAGNDEGDEYYEAEIDLEDLVEMMLEDLDLPRLDPKKKADLSVTDIRYDDIRKKGMLSNLDKKRSLINNLKRSSAKGSTKLGDFHQDDLRFRTWSEHQRPITSAAVIAMMDVSGSMTTDKKYIARSFFFWMVQFLRKKYENVDIVFISHTTRAKIVTEHEFFYQGESGGTKVSSAYELALDTIKERYDPVHYNVFAFHFSDGETFGDEDECVALLKELAKKCNMVGYGEIALNEKDIFGAGYSQVNWSTLLNAYDVISAPNFVTSKIIHKNDVWKTLRKFFAEEIDE